MRYRYAHNNLVSLTPRIRMIANVFPRNKSPLSLILENDIFCTKSRKYSSSVSRLGSRGGPTVIDLIRFFPTGVKKLYNDVQTYHNIKDASTTKENIWSTLRRIPRRQQEQQKRLIRDLKKVALPVTLAILPAIGNIFIALMAIQPRPFLSNHFFTDEQVRYFVSREYYRRRAYFSLCANDFWHTVSVHHFKAKNLVHDRSDNAGPIFDNVMALYSLFENFGQGSSHNVRWNVSLLNALPRDQTLKIAFSSWLASPTLWIQPSILIRYRLSSLAQEIIQDDIVLIEEKQDLQNCNSLTPNELLDACFIRSLPCGLDQDVDDMRQSLSGHLKMMKQVLDEVGPSGLQCSQGSQFVLHLHAIRYEYQG